MKKYALLLVLTSLFSLHAQAQMAMQPTFSEASFLYLLEEEQLAQEVYLAMAEQYEAQVFVQIATAEQRHFDKLKQWAGQKGIKIPTEILEGSAGQFYHEELQTLYDKLVARGKTSLEEALRVGALIEETDIQDLQDAAAGLEAEPELAKTLGQLQQASENHLRAFSRNLQKMDVTYQPVLLDQSTYNGIINTNPSSCAGKGKGKGNCQSGEKQGGKCCSGDQQGKSEGNCQGGKKQSGKCCSGGQQGKGKCHSKS
jgi:hypothetical protein